MSGDAFRLEALLPLASSVCLTGFDTTFRFATRVNLRLLRLSSLALSRKEGRFAYAVKPLHLSAPLGIGAAAKLRFTPRRRFAILAPRRGGKRPAAHDAQ